jgi:hypothetical protein
VDGRRHLLALALALGCAGTPALAGDELATQVEAEQAAAADNLASRVDRALERATVFLVGRQEADGTWRSETYGALADGTALTPFVAKAVLFGPTVEGSPAARERARQAVLDRLDADGEVRPGLAYPVYTISLSVMALARDESPAALRARETFVTFLRSHQLAGELGWHRDDLAYGGWGYSPRPLHRAHFDATRGSLFDADLSSTLCALGALRTAGVPAGDPAVVAASVFIERCQNFGGDPILDDGGFFATPTNSLQNDAGEAGPGAEERTRYRSYGSATADGLRALLRCGYPLDHPRVAAARRWLARHFDPATHAGDFPVERVQDREGAYYYACWTFVHAMRIAGGMDPEESGAPPRWAEDLAHELLTRQAEDGSFRNAFTMMKEDDPLVATPFAAAALAFCRLYLGGEARTERDVAGPRALSEHLVAERS